MRGHVAIMGAGSWGTTLAKVFADAGHCVRLWARREHLARTIQISRGNPDYLSGLVLPPGITASADARRVLADAAIVVLGIPAQRLRDNLAQWGCHIPHSALIVSLAKGIEHGTLCRMSEVIVDTTGCPSDRVTVLSGPNLAREIALEQPAATVIACKDEANARVIQEACSTSYFRPYTNPDVVGVEIGGACKNVIALACGMAAGRGLGENTRATLMTRGLAEISRLGVALGADAHTFAGLAGLGDLVATCSSPLSRNRTFGARLGKGEGMAYALRATSGQVAEGVVSSGSVNQLAQRHAVDMPITAAVYSVCHEDMSVEAMMAALMGRAKKSEASGRAVTG